MVQRLIGGSLINQEKEVMVPASILQQILRSSPYHPTFNIEQAFLELKKIMDTEI